NHTPTTHTYTLSLHDALPISAADDTSLTKICGFQPRRETALNACSENFPNAKIMKTFALLALSCVTCGCTSADVGSYATFETIRSEEHTSELQSRSDLVCRLL